MTKLREDVANFMAGIKQEVRLTPNFPPVRDEEIRLRGRLVIEEAFEFLEALFAGNKSALYDLEHLKNEAKSVVALATPSMNLPDAIDALGDLDVVVEGSRLCFGVDGDPIQQAIQDSNMLKLTGKDDEHGKRQKPAGWTPPDIEALLIAQGWVGGMK